MSGDFWGSQEGCQGPSRPSGRNRGLPLRRRRGQGPHLAYKMNQEDRGVATPEEELEGSKREVSGLLFLFHKVLHRCATPISSLSVENVSPESIHPEWDLWVLSLCGFLFGGGADHHFLSC